MILNRFFLWWSWLFKRFFSWISNWKWYIWKEKIIFKIFNNIILISLKNIIMIFVMNAWCVSGHMIHVWREDYEFSSRCNQVQSDATLIVTAFKYSLILVSNFSLQLAISFLLWFCILLPSLSTSHLDITAPESISVLLYIPPLADVSLHYTKPPPLFLSPN